MGETKGPKNSPGPFPIIVSFKYYSPPPSLPFTLASRNSLALVNTVCYYIMYFCVSSKKHGNYRFNFGEYYAA